jgi:hypothetical protein
MRYFLSIFLLLIIFILSGCSVGHQDWVKIQNSQIGQEVIVEPFKFKNAGKFLRSDFVISGEGLTHVTKDIKGDLVLHWFILEVYSSDYRGKQEWVGKCLMYEVVDPKTHKIKSWGFDKGGNPLSCRTWP